MGDPVGIGPEIVAKALSEPGVRQCCRPIIYGNVTRLRAGARSTGATIDFCNARSGGGAHRIDAGIPVVDPNDVPLGTLEWARPTSACGAAMVGFLNAAVDDAMTGRIDAIATAPINKSALQMAGISFPGHTEILAHRTRTQSYAMMLAGERLRVVLTTIHVPIARVPAALTTAGIATVIDLTNHALKFRFGIRTPRIAVAGLNPHAGEMGLFGDEEKRIIQPAIDQAVARGTDASGPHPPDTIFFSASQGVYDAVIAMYHDQGLGPFKMIHFQDGVNTTLGLPFVRTSVDHCTAYEIAGTGTASAQSMAAAIVMAATQAGWQRRHRQHACDRE